MKHKIIITCFFLCFIKQVKGQSTIEKLGDYSLYSLPFISLGSTILEKDLKGSVMFTKATVLNLVITLGLKSVVKKERPNQENFKSFPSGHTSVTFQNAAFLQKRYGWYLGAPAYLLASYTGFSRVHAKKHYVEDVVAGATIGVLTSYLFTRKRKEKQNQYFYFQKKHKDFSLGYNYKF